MCVYIYARTHTHTDCYLKIQLQTFISMILILNSYAIKYLQKLQGEREGVLLNKWFSRGKNLKISRYIYIFLRLSSFTVRFYSTPSKVFQKTYIHWAMTGIGWKKLNWITDIGFMYSMSSSQILTVYISLLVQTMGFKCFNCLSSKLRYLNNH